jgi:hypothetical protein
MMGLKERQEKRSIYSDLVRKIPNKKEEIL